jgi:hypothetical protein
VDVNVFRLMLLLIPQVNLPLISLLNIINYELNPFNDFDQQISFNSTTNLE